MRRLWPLAAVLLAACETDAGQCPDPGAPYHIGDACYSAETIAGNVVLGSLLPLAAFVWWLVFTIGVYRRVRRIERLLEERRD